MKQFTDYRLFLGRRRLAGCQSIAEAALELARCVEKTTTMGQARKRLSMRTENMLVLLKPCLLCQWVSASKRPGFSVILPTHSLRQPHRCNGGPMLRCGAGDKVSCAAALGFCIGGGVIVGCHARARSLFNLG